MVNIPSDVVKIIAIVAGLVIVPGIAYVVIEKSHEYTGEIGPKTYGNASFPSTAITTNAASDAFYRASDTVSGGRKKNKSRKKNKYSTLRR